MRGKAFLVTCLFVLILLHGTSGTSGNDARSVTSWDQETKTLRLSKAKPYVVNATLVEWGLTIPDGTEGVPCDDGDECLDYGVAKVVVTFEGDCETVDWTTSQLSELKDCVNLLGHWYGGGQQFAEPWPMETNPRAETSYVTSDVLGKLWTYGGVTEAFWISSHGIAVHVLDTIPLFFSLPDHDSDGTADQMCFSSQYKKPFAPLAPDSPLTLTYSLCYADDVRQVYENNFLKYYTTPKDIPDERMFTSPIWSTWAEYLTEVNDSRVIDLAQTIQDQGFQNSQIEIDDKWETCYGDAIFNPDRFSDPKAMVDTLHSMGYRVTLWIHPFINVGCESFQYANESGYFIKDAEGVTQITSWWQGDTAGLIDFTNTDAAAWWTLRLENLKAETGLDSFKFDAGETNWMPKEYVLGLPENYWPNGFTTAYVETVADFGRQIEVRVGHGTQAEPAFVRMMDKNSNWSQQNGLRTLVPSLLHSGIVGYPFVLPDMVGGNAYLGRPSAELFIRWAQANTFMPAIQFSLLPWEFDSENPATTQICRDVADTHESFSPLIIELARNATTGAGPIARPTWWLCPTNEECLMADQQFLLGDKFLITPVVTEGATTLDVVIPAGLWRNVLTDEEFEGVQTITVDVTIETNLYFENLRSAQRNSDDICSPNK